MRRSPRVTLFIERSGLNFLFYKGNSVTCLVTKNSSSRIPPCNRSLSSFKKTYDFISLASVTISRHNFLCGAAERMRTDRHNVHWIKKEKEKIIPPVKDYMHEKDIFRWLHSEFSFFFYVFFFFYFVFNSSGRVFALELLRVALFLKKKKQSPIWSVELHQTQASSYKAVMFASKAQLCQRALQAPPLRSSLRDEKPAVDLCPSVAVRQLMVWASSRLFPSLMRFDRDCCSPVSLEDKHELNIKWNHNTDELLNDLQHL